MRLPYEELIDEMIADAWYMVTEYYLNLGPNNSSKSNNLPDWDIYFPKLAKLEYLSYVMLWKHDIVHEEFEKCAKEHLNSMEVRGKIYRKGQDFTSFYHALEEIVQPVYQSAKNCGFKDWIYVGGENGNN